MWNSPKTMAPTNGTVVVVVLSYGATLAKAYDNGDTWIECEKDGSVVFGRDGSPVNLDPLWWTNLPA